MIKSTVINILKSLSKEEIKSFRKFVLSPYFNTNESTTNGFLELIKFYPEFSSEELSKEYLFGKVYEGKKFSEELFRKLMSNLNILLYEFMKIEGKTTSHNFDLNLLRELFQRRLDLLFDKKANELLNNYSKINPPSVEVFEHISELRLLRADYYFQRGEVDEALIEYQEHAGRYLSAVLIRILFAAMQIEIDNKQMINLPENSLSKFTELLDWDKVLMCVDNKSESALIDLYLRLYRLYKFPLDLEGFVKLKRQVFSYKKTLDKDDLKYALIHLESFCVVYLDQTGDKIIFEQLSELYEFMLKEDIYEMSPTGYLYVSKYRNYLLIFVKTNPLLAKKLLNNYITKVDPGIRTDIENYSKMIIYFSDRKFEEALEYLHKIDFVHFTFKLDIKTYLIKIHFMLGNYEQVLNSIDSYRHFLKDERKSIRFTTPLSDFIKYMNNLTRLILKKDFNEIEFLKQKLESSNAPYERTWLLAVLDEILNKRN